MGLQVGFLDKTLKYVINKYDAVGLSAPQVGVPLKIICVQMTRKQLDAWDPQTVKDRGMEAFKQRILINPESKVIGKVQFFYSMIESFVHKIGFYNFPKTKL